MELSSSRCWGGLVKAFQVRAPARLRPRAPCRRGIHTRAIAAPTEPFFAPKYLLQHPVLPRPDHQHHSKALGCNMKFSVFVPPTTKARTFFFSFVDKCFRIILIIKMHVLALVLAH